MLWENGVTTDLGALSGLVPTAINANRQILGQADSPTGQIRAFLWDNGVLRDLGSLDGGFSTPRAINDSGEVIGQSSFISKGTHGLRAILWQDGVMRNLGTLGSLGSDSNALAVNDLGHVVGLSETTPGGGGDHAFIWESGRMSDLGTLPGCVSTYAVDINEHDQIVGDCTTSTGRAHAVMWTRRRAAAADQNVTRTFGSSRRANLRIARLRQCFGMTPR